MLLSSIVGITAEFGITNSGWLQIRNKCHRGGQIRIYSVAERSERVVTKGEIAQWNRDDSVLYFQRSGRLTDGAELWCIGRDGTGAKKVAELRPMVSIDPFYGVSPRDEIVWVQFKPGAKELWMIDLPK